MSGQLCQAIHLRFGSALFTRLLHLPNLYTFTLTLYSPTPTFSFFLKGIGYRARKPASFFLFHGWRRRRRRLWSPRRCVPYNRCDFGVNVRVDDRARAKVWVIKYNVNSQHLPTPFMLTCEIYVTLCIKGYHGGTGAPSPFEPPDQCPDEVFQVSTNILIPFGEEGEGGRVGVYFLLP